MSRLASGKLVTLARRRESDLASLGPVVANVQHFWETAINPAAASLSAGVSMLQRLARIERLPR